ncbi:rod shape-determining protein MreD [Pseudomonadota bacterium]
MILTIIPLPDWLAPFRPEWLALTLMYWCMALPHRVGVLSGFTLGLLMDVLKGAVLGQHAMALAIMAYLTLKVHQQIRVFPMWQQALSIMGLLILFQMLVMWINGIVDQRGSSWFYWLPTLSSTLLWPWVYLILRDIRRHFGVR